MTLEEAKKLPPEEINRLIAEAIGWTVGAKGWWSAPGHAGTGDDPEPPDYFHDLNAVHEAEMWFLGNSIPALSRRTRAEAYNSYLNALMADGDENEFAPANIRTIALACVLSERKKMKSDSESTISQADISPEQALDKLISPEHEPILEGVRCPQCTEKEAEIARLNALVETEIKCRSDLVSELAWIKSERPAIAKTERELREEIARLIQRIYDNDKTACAKLEMAKEALKSVARLVPGFEFASSSIAKEALKEIGE
jgi:hypothetical protein